MRFASLGSGSRGNATLVEAGDTRVLVDCGFSCAETEKRLERLGLSATELDAILVTHEHSDHISGVARLSRRFRIPVWMTMGTAAVHRGGEVDELHCFSSHQTLEIGDLAVEPFTVPHDAREPCQFVFHDGRFRIGLVTDTGAITPHMVQVLTRLDALVLECNHDPALLASGPYPPSLKQRVGGRFGHLSNEQAAGLLEQIDCSGLQHLLAAHISDKNNRPELAREALANALGCPVGEIEVANQDKGFDWRQMI